MPKLHRVSGLTTPQKKAHCSSIEEGLTCENIANGDGRDFELSS